MTETLTQDNFTAKQKDYAIFLPAISGFYATFIGKQRQTNYVDPARMPAQIQDMEQLNWLNSQQALFPYRWSLYSAGHANLDLAKEDASEDMVRKREPGSFMLGDSGGFQIAKGIWEGDWHANSGCPKAQRRRESVLHWLDNIADYAMILDIPTWVIHDDDANSRIGNFKNNKELVAATRFNNDYFIKHRRGVENGGARFLNVLQGDNHKAADQWYNTMKDYCDPTKYPGRHFDGWAMGGQNMCDVHLVLKRLVELRYDNLLQEGLHDWMHFLGTSKLEWALLLTDIQRAIRRYVNPRFSISFDCASPFLATANGQIYHEIDLCHQGKWSYRMSPSIDDRRYATDTRSMRDVFVTDYKQNYPVFEQSPISSRCLIKDICIYKPGDLNKLGKEGKTSWDSFSYALQMAHNVWMHIEAVQRANREYDNGIYPSMMRKQTPDYAKFRDIVDDIFSAPTRQASIDIIDHYDHYWRQIVGTRGFTGKRTVNAFTMSNELFEVVDDDQEPVLNLDRLNEIEEAIHEQ